MSIFSICTAVSIALRTCDDIEDAPVEDSATDSVAEDSDNIDCDEGRKAGYVIADPKSDNVRELVLLVLALELASADNLDFGFGGLSFA